MNTLFRLVAFLSVVLSCFTTIAQEVDDATKTAQPATFQVVARAVKSQRKHISSQIEALKETIEEIQPKRVETRLRLDQFTEKLAQVKEHKQKILIAIKKIEPLLAKNAELEINGKTYTAEQIEEMARELFDEKKSATEKEANVREATNAYSDVLNMIDSQIKEGQEKLGEFRKTLSILDDKLEIVHAIESAKSLTPDDSIKTQAQDIENALRDLSNTLDQRIDIKSIQNVINSSRPTRTVGQESEWIQLFNGRDLEGWTPKIRTYELGENFGNTFRVEDGILKVGYEAYGDKFDKRFGHLFYDESFSHYILRVEYRFVGQQIAGGPGWAFRNSGLMLHGQDPATMEKDQEFPVSIEVQLLGGDGTNPRTNANLCTPGTNVEIDGQLVRRHCTSSTSETFHGDQWVTLEVEVRGGEVIRHKIDDVVVLEYQKPQLDDRDGDAKKLITNGKLILTQGSISLQSESHPVEFRKVELKKIDP